MRDTPYETYEKHGITIEIHSDDDPQNPRTDWDQIDHMICFHRRYDLGDKHTMSPEDLMALLKKKNVIWLPLYLYDHSGITMYTSGDTTYHQHAAWDTSNVGAIYMTIAEGRKNWGRKISREELVKKMVESMKGSVQTYDQFLTGDVWGYVVDPDGEHDSCWGYFGTDDCKAEAESVAQYIAESRRKAHESKLKAQIKHNVPLDKRLVAA